jgi:hypothetical protein
MKQIDKSVVKVIGSFVNKTIPGFELVGIEYQKSARLWDDYELSEERIIRTNIFVKKQKELSIDELKEIVFQIGDSGRIISNNDVSNIPLSVNIDFKILD